ncbi:PaaI family thioesterase [Mycobacterium sp. SA01]|uniref:PaaI family thioesterase n=1 Tax=Mycobacterium sp. SA01 TaxID=3238820 RepID=UPI00351AFC4A
MSHGEPDNQMRAVDVERGEAVFAPLTRSVRHLIDATIRTEVDAETVVTARALIERATELLAAEMSPGSFGVQTTTDGGTVAWGNVAIGLRNPVAPPLVIHGDADGSVHTEVDLGAAFEGPPGHVHGGVCALILDHMLGATAHQPGNPAFTGTLTVRYVRPTRLGRVHAEARVDRHEGIKTFAVGRIADADGMITVEAHGVFIRPKRTSADGG